MMGKRPAHYCGVSSGGGAGTTGGRAWASFLCRRRSSFVSALRLFSTSRRRFSNVFCCFAKGKSPWCEISNEGAQRRVPTWRGNNDRVAIRGRADRTTAARGGPARLRGTTGTAVAGGCLRVRSGQRKQRVAGLWRARNEHGHTEEDC